MISARHYSEDRATGSPTGIIDGKLIILHRQKMGIKSIAISDETYQRFRAFKSGESLTGVLTKAEGCGLKRRVGAWNRRMAPDGFGNWDNFIYAVT